MWHPTLRPPYFSVMRSDWCFSNIMQLRCNTFVSRLTWMWRSVQSVWKWQAPAVQQHLGQRGRHDLLTSVVRSSLGFCLVSWRRRKSTSEHRPTATLHAPSHKVSAAGEITSMSHISHVYGLDLHAGKKLFCSTGKIPPQESIRNNSTESMNVHISYQ